MKNSPIEASGISNGPVIGPFRATAAPSTAGIAPAMPRIVRRGVGCQRGGRPCSIVGVSRCASPPSTCRPNAAASAPRCHPIHSAHRSDMMTRPLFAGSSSAAWDCRRLPTGRSSGVSRRSPDRLRSASRSGRPLTTIVLVWCRTARYSIDPAQAEIGCGSPAIALMSIQTASNTWPFGSVKARL
jgi:hypothetical protein